jgi:type 1 glutamine amidotransferase
MPLAAVEDFGLDHTRAGRVGVRVDFSPTAISTMTGVFHFMAVSLGLILAGGKVGSRRSAVTRQSRSSTRSLTARPPRAEPMTAGIRWSVAVLAILSASIDRGIAAETPETRFAVLVFSKTSGFRHDSIPRGIAVIEALGAEHGFAVDSTEDAARFTDAALGRYKVIVFLNTTGDVLDVGQKAAFERYIRSGGGFVGIHSASDTEYRWPWYGRLVGAYFASHPQIQRARVRTEDANHPSTKGLPAAWERTDEWYNFRSNPRGAVHILATLDESTYSGGTMGADHPIAWCQAIDGGRSWYTAMGHTIESYAEPIFRRHLLGGVESAAGVAGGCAGGGERPR